MIIIIIIIIITIFVFVLGSSGAIKVRSALDSHNICSLGQGTLIHTMFPYVMYRFPWFIEHRSITTSNPLDVKQPTPFQVQKQRKIFFFFKFIFYLFLF